MCPITLGIQPQPDPKIEFYLNLWSRCKRYECLPDSGGLLDQEERLMKILDYISSVVDERDKKKRKREQAEQESRARSQRTRRI